MIVREAIETLVKERERTWSHDRTQTVGASEIGQCARKVWALKFEREPGMATPRDPDFTDTWGARERGNLIEQHLLVPAILKCYGNRAKLLGAEQQTFTDGFISCTPDCLIAENGTDCFLIEFKSIDPRALLPEAKPEHVYQAQVQMGMLHAVSKWRPAYTIVSYTDASFLSETKEFVIDYDPAIYQAAKRRSTRIMTASTLHELQPEGWMAGGRECEYCPFTIACGHSRRRVPELDHVADPQFVAEISDRAKSLKFVEHTIELQEKQRRELQYEIKERLREKGVRRIVGDGVSVSWTSVKGRETTDIAGLKEAAVAAGIDVQPFNRPGEPGDRLTVTLKAKQREEKENEPRATNNTRASASH